LIGKPIVGGGGVGLSATRRRELFKLFSRLLRSRLSGECLAGTVSRILAPKTAAAAAVRVISDRCQFGTVPVPSEGTE